jgi:hypothetical protein
MAACEATAARTELERWYSLDLRPKLARAADRRAIDPAQAAAFELAMAELIGTVRPAAPRVRDR